MILLTDEEIYEIYYESRNANQETPADIADNYGKAVAKAQLKRALIGIGKESKRMDGTIYLVPDYVEYRKALKEVGLE